jgi:hypothetical protein
MLNPDDLIAAWVTALQGVSALTLALGDPAAFDAAVTYDANDEVMASGIRYLSLQSGNVGHSPAASPTWWQAVGESRVQGYYDRFPSQNNLRRAILDQPPGSILVVFMGTNKARVGGAIQFRHQFTFAVRAPESVSGSGSYGQIWGLFVNGVPTGKSLPLLHTPIHSGCYPMDLELPTAQRTSLLISVDGATQDYFEIQASLIELSDNQG